MSKIEVDAYDLTRMLILLDGCDDALTAAAEREKRREANKRLRCITEQERAETVREFVTEMTNKYGV